MAKFPKIDSPCPFKANLAAVMDGDHCTACHRNVVDLTAWSDDQRASFLARCEGEVCVSYRLPVKPALIAAAMAAAVVALPAAAQDAPAPAAVSDAPQAEDLYGYGETEIIVGGIKDPKNTALTEDAADADLPEMPVVYETPAAPPPKPETPVSGKR